MGKEWSTESLILLRPNLNQETIMEAKFSSITGSISKQSAESRQRKPLCQGEREPPSTWEVAQCTMKLDLRFDFSFASSQNHDPKQVSCAHITQVSSSVNWRLGNTHESNETAMECLAEIRYPTRWHLHPGSLPPSNSSWPGGYYTSSHKGMWLSLGLGQQDND